MSEDIHKWTDGRYTLMFDEHTFFVFDNEKEEQMTALQVTKKLNEQQVTIQSLKEELKLEQDFTSRWQKESEMLAEENKELKHWKKRIIEYLTNWFNKTEYLTVLYKINEINNEIGLDSDE